MVPQANCNGGCMNEAERLQQLETLKAARAAYRTACVAHADACIAYADVDAYVDACAAYKVASAAYQAAVCACKASRAFTASGIAGVST